MTQILVLKLINAIGLLMDVAGALLMFYNTPRHSRKPIGGHSGWDEFKRGADYLVRGKALDNTEWGRIRVGLVLIVMGFIGQLAAVILA